MRTEEEMMGIIRGVAEADARVRAVCMNGPHLTTGGKKNPI